MNQEKEELGIYIHIPFCKQKCFYCDFISYSNQESKMKEYVEAVKKEINSYHWKEYRVTTIYLGGGTPSYLDDYFIEAIIKKIQEQLKENEVNWEDLEITIEINPGTVTKEKLETYHKLGINRLSIGLQSTNDNLLKQIGRIHTYQDFLDTYHMAKEVGFENINVDLMIGLPNQTIQDLKDSFEKIKNLDPNHISVYSLIVEEGTKIEQLLTEEKIKLPEEEKERQMYWYIKNTLELNGYCHYEISNFSKQGKESNHNLNCWEQKQYIGIGVAAHSYLNQIRYSNTENLEKYIQFVEDSEKIRTIEETQTIEDQKKEYMLLGLRKIEGVSILKFKTKFVDNPLFLYHKEIQQLVKEELMQVNGDCIQLTNRGLDVANLVWEEFV